MRKFLATVLITSVTLGAYSSGVAAEIPDEQWSIMEGLFDKTPEKTGISLLGLSIQDNTDLSERVSSLVGSTDGSDNPLSLRLCKSIRDDNCAPGKAKYLNAFLPVCENPQNTNCILGVSAVKGGVEIPGKYERNFPEKGYTDFPASAVNNVPQGSTPSLWNFPGLTHTGRTSQYLVSFIVTAGFNGGSKASFGSYAATLNAVSIRAGAYGRNEARDATGKDAATCGEKNSCGMEMVGHSGADKFVCASLEDGFCAVRETLPSGVRFKIEVRLSQSPTGWLHGRMKNPNIDIKEERSGVQISVEAEPVTVPVVGILEDYSKLPAEMQRKYANPTAFYWGNGNSSLRSNALLMPSPDSQEAFEAMEIWKDYIKDKANASPTEWAVRTMNYDVNLNRCLKSTSELVGIVTTNSMVYLGGPPIFNKGSQTLDYKVGSPHYTSKGEVFKGTYDLQLKSSVARCLYSFTNAPISATVSIVNNSGDSNIATTVVNERDGWLRMAAYGFTFSTPTVQVKLSQEKTKKTISCIKGKSVKKVSAVNPKCPSGYKKKVS